ncbi:MAG: hypothetical protein GTN93_07340, partial [Anaerolineae bacterium]|nr:hypothetical protein [Anaerolineae bacterium]
VILEALEEKGKLNTNEIIDVLKEKKAYHKTTTLKQLISALAREEYVESIETERAMDKGGRMTVQVWKLGKKKANGKKKEAESDG